MSLIPYLVFSRVQEERALANCDGTCVSGPRCVAVVDLGSETAGQALPSLSRCVLCCRASVTAQFNACMFHGSANSGRGIVFNPYVNMTGDYDPSLYLDRFDMNVYKAITGPFIAYERSHYNLVGPNSIVQISIGGDKRLNWFNSIFNQNVCPGPLPRAHISGRPWQIAICQNPKCKINILTFVNRAYAEGFDNTVFDMERNKLCCIKCQTPVTMVGSEEITRGNVARGRHLFLNHDDKWDSRCAFCRTVVEFDKFRCPQTCDSCEKNFIDQAIESTKICYYCSSPVGLTRRGGAQTLSVGDETVYFCKQHRIKGPVRTYTPEEFKELMG